MHSLYCTFDLAHILSERPCAGNYGTSQLYFLAPLLFSLLASVPRKIFSPMSEQHHAGNWCYSHSTKLRMYCSLDTSCSVAWLLIVDWSITTCSILCVTRLVLVAHHPFSLDSNKDLTSLCTRLPPEDFSTCCRWQPHSSWEVIGIEIKTNSSLQAFETTNWFPWTHSCAPGIYYSTKKLLEDFTFKSYIRAWHNPHAVL